MRRKSITHFAVAAIIIGWLVTIVTLFPQCSGKANAQTRKPTKDSIPPQQNKYAFVIDKPSYRFVDSVLFMAIQTAGYELSMKNGNELRAGLSGILNYFRQSVYAQDSIYNAELKKPKK